MSGAICRVCALENAEGARFCSSCGAALIEHHATGDALVGKNVAGKFRIDRLLGHGAMGRVYLATHIALERQVAIKVMHDHLARSGEFATRFVREARAASKLDHPNSIRVLDFGRADADEKDLRALYLVMEYFPGSDLFALLRDEGPFELVRGGNIVAQVLAALEDAHAIGLIHRDLKPENVLVGKKTDGTEIAKLCDFGIAKVAQEEQGPKLSQVGSMIGTPLYMSPEAACGRETDARSDLYSVGVMLYEIATGSRPFDAPSPLEVARLQVEEVPQAPTVRAPERRIPVALERVILRALAKQARDRWQSAKELRAALVSALGADRGGAEATPCVSCGSPISRASRFCPSCGTPRTASANRMAAPTVPPAPLTSKPPPGGVDKLRSLAGIVPDRLLGDLRRAQSEGKQERRTLVALAIELVGDEVLDDPEELAGRIGDRFERIAQVLEPRGAVMQGAGGTRVTAIFGLGDSTTDSAGDGPIGAAIEGAFAAKDAIAGARWFKAGLASGVFLVTPSTTGGPPTILGAATQTASRYADVAGAGEILVDEAIRSRVGEGFTSVARGALHAVRPDVGFAFKTASGRPFVGRDAELEAVLSAARDAHEGRGRVVAIRGEAGIGKTSLVREAIVRSKDLRWVRVACRPTGQAAFGAFRELVLAYTGIGRGASVVDVRRSLDGERGSLSGLGLGAEDRSQIVSILLGPARSAGQNAPEVVAREGAAAIRSFLQAALSKGSVAFVVEDLQWIDAASAGLLAQLANVVGKRGALLVLTARAGIWSDWNAPHFTRIQLGPLPAGPAATIVQSILSDGELPQQAMQSILQRAGGNPLFLESIVESLRASKALSLDGGRYVLAPDANIVAEGLRGLVEARVRSLPADAQRTAAVAAVIGNECDVADLQALAGPTIHVEEAAKALAARGVFEERARGEAGARRLGFVNDGVREVLYDTIPIAERRALHGAIAERWEAIRAATKQDATPIEELARHWELAGELRPAVARLEEAATGLARRGEAKGAIALAKRAASHLAQVDPSTGARVLLLLADVHAQLGEVGAVDAALAGLAALKLDPAAASLVEAKADRARGLAARRSGRPQDAAVALQRALDRALQARDTDLACDLHLDLAAALEESNDTQRALQAALGGVEMASALADRASKKGDDDPLVHGKLAALLNVLGRLYLRRDDAVRASDYFRGSLAQAEKANDSSAAARALANLGAIAARRDDFRAAAAESTRALRLAQESGDRLSQARIQVNLGHYLARLGRREEAEQSYRAAQALAEAIGWNEGVAVAHQALEANANTKA